MIRLSPATYRAVWTLLWIIVGAGWAAYGIVGGGNSVFLANMVVATMVLFGGAGVLLKRE